MYTADFDAFMPILFQTDLMKAQTVWSTFLAGPMPPNMNIAVATLKANVNFQLLLRTIVDVFDCNYVLAQYLVFKGPVGFRNQIGTYADLKNCYRNVFGDYFLANIMDLYDRQLLWTHMFATHPAGFWADLLISVNPIEFGRIAFKYFPNEANQLMINANISITDYFSLIESYPGLGNAYLSNLKNTLMNMGYTAAGWTYLADEHHIYGSSSVGVHNTHFVLAKRFSTAEMEYTQKTGNQVHFIRGKRNYELSNHLGNVQVIISDKRISVCDNELQTESFEADILMATDYYPFGMAIPERQWYTGSDSSNYRFGFNGMEKDNEAKGPGNSLDFGARIYDCRLGRWLSVDPAFKQYVSLSTYLYTGGNPIMYVELDGRIFDISKMSDQQRQEYDAIIAILMQSEFFKYYYEKLEKSTTVYKVVIDPNMKNSGKFTSSTETVTLNKFGVSDGYAVAQELFHAFQWEIRKNIYNGTRPLQNIESEGDIASVYVAVEVGLVSPAPEWQEELMKLTNYEATSVEQLNSSEYQEKYRKLMELRQTFYLQDTKAYDYTAPSYTALPQDFGPEALDKVLREVEADKSMCGPQLENGNYYSN